ncbi:MAG: acyltransferase [Acidimicrobiia bacterium]|nr:acyltransferase [Acidimicrobiia bacterium]
MSETSWGYRPGLDGLRCVAVLLVVAFHARVPSIANGFVGVDVFFVLSGFLVTSVVLATGLDAFRFGEFYARRVRRLLPAAVTAVVVTCASLLLYVPRLTRGGLVSDARAALLYVANWHFIREATDYFAEDIDASPFLHYWSLAIEEQFYLLYPFVLIGLYRLARRRFGQRASLNVVAIGIAALAAASLGAQLWWAGRDPLRAYYGTEARLYQLLVGGTLAAVVHFHRHRAIGIVRRAATPVGLAALVLVIFLGTGSWSLSVSARGILVTAAAIVLIVSMDLAPSSAANLVLSVPVLRYLGRISYMIYLAHWPLILLLRELFDIGPIVLTTLAAFGSAGIAALSFEVLEQPVRRGKLLARAPRLSIIGGLALSFVAAFVVVPPILRSDVRPAIRETVAIVVTETDVVPTQTEPAPPEPTPEPRRVDEPDGDAANASVDDSAASPDDADPVTIQALLAAPVPDDIDYDTATTGQPGYSCAHDELNGCVLVDGGSGHIHLIGDSNASMLRAMLSALAGDHDLTYSESTYQGCPWQKYLGTTRTLDECYELRLGWYERLAVAEGPDLIIAANLDYEFEQLPNAAIWTPTDGTETFENDDLAAVRAMVMERTIRSIDELVAGGATIVLVEPVGYHRSTDPTACLSGAATIGECAFERPPHSPMTEIYREIAARRDDVVSIDIDRFACPHLPVCLPVLDGKAVFKDRTHLSVDYTVPTRAAFWQLLLDAGATLG